MADRLFAVSLMVIAGAFWRQTGDLPGASGGAALGPAFLPRIILGCIFVLAAVVMIQSLVKTDQAVRFTGIGAYLRLHWRVPVLLGAIAAYIAAMDLFGFVIASIAFLLGTFALLIRDYTRGVLIAAAVLSLALPFGLNWLFETLLRTVLP